MQLCLKSHGFRNLFFSLLLIFYPYLVIGAESVKKGSGMERSSKKFMVARYDEKSHQFLVQDLKLPRMVYGYLFDAEMSPSGQIYLFTTDGILRLNKGSLEAESVNSKTPEGGFSIDPEGSIYVAGPKGLLVSKDHGKTFAKKEVPRFDGVALKNAAVDAKQNYYLATESGLLVSLDRGETFKKILVDPDSPDSNENHLYNCFLSKQGALACTSWHGVLVFSQKDMTMSKAPIGSAESTQIAFDSHGRLHGIDAPPKSIFRSDDKLKNFKAYEKEWGLSDLSVASCFIDSKDRLFVYGSNDVAIRLPAAEKFEKLKIIGEAINLFRSKIFESPSGDVFLISWIPPFGDLED